MALLPMLILSSCAILADSSSTDYRENYENYGYHFTAEAPNGQLLCYRYLNSQEVGCVTPWKYKDPTTGTSINYELSGDVVIPKTVSDGVNTYTVSALLCTPDRNVRNIYWGGYCNVTNLVIPETVKVIERAASSSYVKKNQLGGNNVKNIIVYGPTDKRYYITDNSPIFEFTWNNYLKNTISITNEDEIKFSEYDSRLLYDGNYGLKGNLGVIYINTALKPTNYWIHVPQGVFNKDEIAKSGNTIEIVDNYDIYAEGNSLKEYLQLANYEIRQKWMMNQGNNIDADFAVLNNQGAREGTNRIMYFKITDNDNHFVKLQCTINSGGDTLVIPNYVTHHKIEYIVTAARENYSKYIVIPETCKDVAVKAGEVICYSSDINFNSKPTDIGILHVPHGCVEKYKDNAGIACLEIVDGYSVYEKGHSIKEYLSMSREIVEKARAEKILADQKAEEAKRQKEAAEWKAYRQELTKKYGAKHVNALFDKGQITIGMPIELFDIGLAEHLFKNPRINNVTLEAKTANGYCLRMTAINLNTLSSYFVGFVWFIDDKVSAVSY